jgi:hypothetical protein
MPIKSFRGKMVDGAIDTITLHTNDGSTGYRIKRFDIFPAVQDSAKDSLVCISKIEPAAAITTADFSDNTLLGAALMFNGTYEIQQTIVFDNEVFNQDIYITNNDSIGSNAMNYYIELEQIKLDLSENTVATLKDIRNQEARFI